MRIGISSYWFNRGQAVVARQLRSTLDALGHETFVLARPTRPSNPMPAFVDRGDVWDQPGVREASAYRIPAEELVGWARENELEVAFFDQNYQFEEIARLRELGMRTIGRFVWEHFAPGDVAGAREAFDVIYSLTDCERRRYAELGIESPRVHWGCHPELLQGAEQAACGDTERPESPSMARIAGRSAGAGGAGRPASGDGAVTYFFPGGFMSRRKPLGPTLKAFRATRDRRLRLVVKSQVARGEREVRRAARRDPRIELVVGDLPAVEHLRLFAAADVCLAPSRWEGLGLHLYEATALGLPIITNDNPPMNEVVREGVNGILVRGRRSRARPRSGIPSFDPDRKELTEAIERVADPELRDQLAAGAVRMREELSWDRTVADVRDLLAALA
jgi:1,2-diacylglycerol 3-alpha-glucosyltransferase